MKRPVRVSMLLALSLASCVTTSRSHRIGRVWTETNDTRAPGDVHLALVRAAPEEVLVRATQVTECLTIEVQKTEHETVITSSPIWPWVVGDAVLGVVGFGIGGYLLVTAADRPALDDKFSRGEFSTEGSIAIGLPLAVIGSVGGAALLGTLLATGETVEHVKVLEAPGSPTRTLCGEGPLRETEVTLSAPASGNEFAATTDETGLARFELDRFLPTLPRSRHDFWLIAAVGSAKLGINSDDALLADAIRQLDTLAGYTKFRELFPVSPSWHLLEARYRELVSAELRAQEEAAKLRLRELLRLPLDEKGSCLDCAVDVVAAVKEELTLSGNGIDEALRAEAEGRIREILDARVLHSLNNTIGELVAWIDSDSEELMPTDLRSRVEVELRADNLMASSRVTDLRKKLQDLLGAADESWHLSVLERSLRLPGDPAFDGIWAVVSLKPEGRLRIDLELQYDHDPGPAQNLLNIGSIALGRGVQSRATILDGTALESAIQIASSLWWILYPAEANAACASNDEFDLCTSRQYGDDTEEASYANARTYFDHLLRSVEIQVTVSLARRKLDGFAQPKALPPSRLRSGFLSFSAERLRKNNWENILQIVERDALSVRRAEARVRAFGVAWKTW